MQREEGDSVAAGNLAGARALVGALVASGLRQVCLSPGSRSTPLAWAFAERAEAGELRLSVHLDERAAAFYALGWARAAEAPAALVCSSGSAGANYLPALIEAHYSRVPLVVLTADRPPELRDSGAWQTIDQAKLYGGYVRWYHELALPDELPARLRYAAAVGGRALAVARARPAGPVHLNVPFREPLAPPADAPPPAPGRALAYEAPTGRLPDAHVEALAARIAAEPRGLILAGRMPPEPGLARAVLELAAAAGWPVLAEPGGGLRFGVWSAQGLVAGYDAILRHRPWAEASAPGLVLRLGASFVWKQVAGYLGLHPEAEQIVVDPDRTWDDPTFLAAERLAVEPAPLCAALTEALRARPAASAGLRGAMAAAWRERWSAAMAAQRAAREEALARTEPDAEGRARSSAWVYPTLVQALPPDALLWAANSMAVRDLDGFTGLERRRIRVLASRGAAGIDGTVSTALGAAAAHEGPCALVTGDLAFLHDAGGLAAAEPDLDLAIVVVDDGGGGIFEHLEVAERDRPRFERLFATPQRTDVAALCAAYGLPCRDANRPEALAEGLAGEGVRVLRVPVDRAANTAAHRAYWADVARRLDALGAG